MLHQDLADVLDLAQLDLDLFQGGNLDIGTDHIFGGQVLGQAVVAAQRTVDAERRIHSLHAYFLRHGDRAIPIQYAVDRSRDGTSFSARRVVAMQQGDPLFTLSVSFQILQPGLEYSPAGPRVPSPEDAKRAGAGATEEHLPRDELPEIWARISAPFDIVPVRWSTTNGTTERTLGRQAWFRLRESLDLTARQQPALLAYLSDYGLLTTVLIPHDLSLDLRKVRAASIDHALWLHRPFDLRDWLLFVCEPVSSSGARGLARGSFYARDGTLVATVMQEGLLRLKTDFISPFGSQSAP